MNTYTNLALAIMACLPALTMAMEAEKSPLHTAAANWAMASKVHEILHWRTQEVDQQDGDGNTPLHEAAYFGCKENADLLLHYGADVNKRNYKGETPLDKAHYSNKPELETLLKEYGGEYSIYKQLNKKVTQQELDTILWDAGNNYHKMLSALKRGANANMMRAYAGTQMTLLHRIAMSGSYDTPYNVMEVLLKYGADINKLDNQGWTPYGRSSGNSDSQTGTHFSDFFEAHNARFKKGK